VSSDASTGHSNPHTEIHTDLVVVGGGIAGCTAAMAAARLGLDVALVQERPVLGGNASSEIGLLMAGADRDHPHVREGGLVEEIELANRYYNHEIQWRNSISDAILEAQVKNAGVQLYLNTHVYGLAMQDAARITSVSATQQTTEQGFRFSAPCFVDATGDGALAALSGAPCMRGSEARDAFDESLAPATASNTTMGSTLMYRVRDMGRPVRFVKPPWAYSFPDPDDLPVRIKDLDQPQLWIETGARMDTIRDNMAIREELLKILYGVWDHIKNHGDYGAENYVLAWVGSVPGKRESRRVIGDYILTQQDLTDPQSFPDAVAYGGWPIDVHNPDGFYAKKKWLDYTHLDKPYPIPYRCYYSKAVQNLFLAGRIISATHVAHGSIRLMRTCAVGGQAVGTAAALCHKYGKTARQIGTDHVQELQQLLLKHDCYIPGIVNTDPGDLARQAMVSASSELAGPAGRVHGAEKTTNGLSRGTTDDENLWISKSMDEDAEPWLQLAWSASVAINRVHLTFDTMMREQRFFDRPLLGALPTCVRDAVIECREGSGDWRKIGEIRDNFQRHCIIAFPATQTDAIRVRIQATHGDPHARIYEVRAYQEESP